MKSTLRVPMCGAIAVLLVVSAASAQTLDQVCPNAPDGIGALYGEVVDPDAAVPLPGATVIATWDVDGSEQRVEGAVGLEGFYALCLPRETPISIHAAFSGVTGVPLEVTMVEEFTQQDLRLSMARATAADDRLWLCVNRGQSEINIRFTRLVRCDEEWQPLERCPKVELGKINVQPVGAGSGMLREMVEQLVQEAKRLGANAVVNVHDGRGGTTFTSTVHATAIVAEGVRIDVDPLTC